VQTLSFRMTFGTEVFARQGGEHWPIVEAWVENTAEDAVLGIDLHGAEYFGLSYAKRTVLELLLRREKGELGERRFFIIAPANDPELLEGLQDALKDHGRFMLLSESEDPLSDPKLIGDVPAAVQETFDVLKRSAPITTGSLARLLDQTPQATKNRLDRFAAMGLLTRVKVPSPTGGLEWENRIF
jgi:hypothetical protein